MNENLILVTGSAGRIGQAVVKELQRRGQPVRGFDLRPTPGLVDSCVGGITDADALQRALAGVTTLIHLAATPDDADFVSELLPNNLLGVYLVFEAARKAGVRRMILASSGQVVWHQRLRGPLPIDANVQVTPRYWYAATKVFLEAAGRAYSETHGISVIAVRLGWCPRTPGQVAEIAADRAFQDVYLSPGDAGRFFACAAMTSEEIPFAIVYATSKPVHEYFYDLDEAGRLLGYEPREQWPEGIDL